ncbi:hypothetical protein [Pectobacterium phage vB_ParM-25]|nr:hypothetical protein [Pectobacterium phage vB_ParM-25]
MFNEESKACFTNRLIGWDEVFFLFVKYRVTSTFDNFGIETFQCPQTFVNQRVENGRV